MGVKIHYKGEIKARNLIPKLVTEVEDICIANLWLYKTFHDSEVINSYTPPPKTGAKKPQNDDIQPQSAQEIPPLLTGIIFQITPNCEAVALLFDAEGRLHSFDYLLIGREKGEKHAISTITQFAGVETHIKIINILKYLKPKYFKNLDIHDTGHYYPDNNKEALIHHIINFNKALILIQQALKTGIEGNSQQVVAHIEDLLLKADIHIEGLKVKLTEKADEIIIELENE